MNSLFASVFVSALALLSVIMFFISIFKMKTPDKNCALSKHSLNNVRSLVNNGNYNQALSILNAARANGPSNPQDKFDLDFYTGLCLHRSKRNPDSQNLREAIAYFDAILKEASTKHRPFNVSLVFNELGLAYSRLSKIESENAYLLKARNSFLLALKNLSPRHTSAFKAALQYRLGSIYHQLSQTDTPDTLECLNQAAKYLSASLSGFSVRKNALDVAQVELLLAKSFFALSHHENQTANLFKAFEHAKSALTIFKQQPIKSNQFIYLGSANYILGCVFLEQSKNSQDPAKLRNSLFSLLKAMRYFKKQNSVQEIAQTHQQLMLLFESVAKENTDPKYQQKILYHAEQALQVFSIAKYPYSFATIQFHLGVWYREFAQKENIQLNLLKSAAYFDNVFLVFNERTNTSQYTEACFLQAKNFCQLAEFSNPQQSYQQALSHIQAALRGRKFSSELNEGEIYTLAGSLYHRVASFEEKPDRIVAGLNAAIVTYDVALSIYNKEEYPSEHAKIVNDLGQIYMKLATLKAPDKNLHSAISSLEEIAASLSPENNFSAYLETNYNLARANLQLSKIEDSDTDLERSVDFYEKIYKICEKSPEAAKLEPNYYLEHAEALKTLALRKNKPNNYLRAGQILQSALKLYKEDTDPENFSRISLKLGETLSEASQLSEKEFNLTKANTNLEKALQHLDPKRNHTEYLDAAYLLGQNYIELDELSSNPRYLEEALRHFNNIIPLYNPRTDTDGLVNALNNIAVVCQKLSERSFDDDQKSYLLKSIQVLKDALKYCNSQETPFNFAMTQNNLGTAYSLLADIQHRDVNLTLALQALSAAQKIYRDMSSRDEYRKVSLNIEKIKMRFRTDAAKK